MPLAVFGLPFERFARPRGRLFSESPKASWPASGLLKHSFSTFKHHFRGAYRHKIQGVTSAYDYTFVA